MSEPIIYILKAKRISNILSDVTKNGPENKTDPACPMPSKSETVIYIKEGQLCPNCRFAKLIREPGRIIRCPICGWGNAAGCT
ncbi:MAG: hypothetical protein CVT49_04325 [candidate division Zixibacteria bacterium HGW-Zixibacteria-1]|nr:MAG: hypothetical protein CVT49_04325 [candidate division Zixibacteria bacterium HGW-Zixibacteria-1]